MSEPSPTIIREALANYFSLGELRTLCFDLGIDYEDLEGGSKQGKTLALVQYAQRHNRYPDLVNAVRQARPHLNLDAAATRATAPAKSQPTASQPGQQPNIIVQGDYIAGDKTGGDKVKGDKISAGNISGSNVAIGRGAKAASQTSTGDTYNFSGNFSGAILNVNSKLENATQTIHALPRADEATKAKLEQLVAQLQEQLQQLPPEKEEDAEAVAELTETLIDTANKEKPNKQLLQITGDGLKQAAKNLAAIAPDVAKIAGTIVATILTLA